jgi:hypothetical protein
MALMAFKNRSLSLFLEVEVPVFSLGFSKNSELSKLLFTDFYGTTSFFLKKSK